jgi:hypothetical protein
LRLQQDEQQLQMLQQHPANKKALAVLPALFVKRDQETKQLLLDKSRCLGLSWVVVKALASTTCSAAAAASAQLATFCWF